MHNTAVVRINYSIQVKQLHCYVLKFLVTKNVNTGKIHKKRNRNVNHELKSDTGWVL